MAEPFPLAPALWSATACPPPPTPALEESGRADVVIVGAGYAVHQKVLVSRFRSSHHCAAASFANFGIEGH